ncbi:MAG: PRC-barrel domain-containing protein, partial [Cyanobacteria bacterium CAN_BIN43]|nr:PRC-barrel domain-containing protein [Cyanobacteria bacterium CAN_BIN43]
GNEVIGKPVVSYSTGRRIDTIKDLIFDQNSNRLLGFLISEGGWLSSPSILLLKDVLAIGVDAVIISSRDNVFEAKQVPEIAKILEYNNVLKGTRILTTDGRNLGTMVDLYFDNDTGIVEGYEVSGGMFADAYSGRSFVPTPKTLKIGKDVAFVPVETALLMEEQIGGIKAAMQAAGEKVQETVQSTGEKLQDAGGKLKQSSSSLSQNFSGQFNSALAGRAVEEAKGYRVRQFVRSDDGFIIAAPGQIVSDSVIKFAQQFHQEEALLQAVGLSTRDAAQSRANSMAMVTGDRLRVSTHKAEDQIQEGAQKLKVEANYLWQQLRTGVADFQDRSSQAIEQKRILGALGRPVNRVILDQQDQVILNVGELITHQAVEISRQSGVLEVLLGSVYTETPKLSREDIEAPHPGRASLT